MKVDRILTNRFVTMGLGEEKFPTINEMLTRIGAIQCQDVQAGKWALGLRLKNATLDSVDQLLKRENIIRIHILRPTWHYVLSEDVRWMLELTAPRIRSTIAVQFRLRGVNEELCVKTRTDLKELLTGKKELTYTEIQKKLVKKN